MIELFCKLAKFNESLNDLNEFRNIMGKLV